MKSFVSVCIPTYLQIPFLRKTLESIQAQEFTDYELVISDDSPDNSVQELLREFHFSGKLIYSKNTIALGSPANWNRAVELSSGELIKIMHHDDWFSGQTSLGDFVALIGSDPKIGFAFSGVNTKSPHSDSYTHQYASAKEVHLLRINRMPLMLKNCIGSPSSTIIRRECFHKYRENLQWLVDVFQYAEVLDKTEFAFTSKALIYSTTDAEHQITNSCQNNPDLLVYEYLYFFDQIKKLGKIKLNPYTDYLNELILKCGVKQESNIRQYGYEGDIPHQTLEIMKLSSLGKRLKLLELKISRKANEVWGYLGKKPLRSIKLSLLTNFISQIWGALIGFLFIPVYVRILGIESYGIIGFFATLQAWFILLDLGLTPALGREMSRFLGGVYTAQAIRNLLRSLEILCMAIALIILSSIYLSSSYFGYQWFKPGELEAQTIHHSLIIIAALVALRYVEGFYRAALIGLQLQIWCNLWNIFLASLRNIGVIGVLLWASPTLEAYFLWHTLVSFLAMALYLYKLNTSLPKAPHRTQFSLPAVKGIWKFAGGMVAINFISMMLTQLDKLLLSKLLDLNIYGYYILAATLASICYMVVGPITSGFFPFMVEKSTQAEESTLIRYYHQGSQLVTALTSPVALVLLFFAEPAIFMWTDNMDLAKNAAPILSVLVIGCYLNSLMWMPNQFQLANGVTKIILIGNLLATMIFVPGIYFLLPIFGVVGIAWFWVAINLGFISIMVPIMHRQFLRGEMWKWYLQDTLSPLLAGLTVIVLTYLMRPHVVENRGLWFFYLAGSGLLVTIATTVSASLLRKYIIEFVKESLRKRAIQK